MNKNFAIIGVGNMAKAIITGILSSDLQISSFYLYDKVDLAYESFIDQKEFIIKKDIKSAVEDADCVLLSVKPQNFPEVLTEIKSAKNYDKKLYISIAAGITSESVSTELGGAKVIRVLPNLPMTIGMGVSVICKNDGVSAEDFEFVKAIFASSGSTVIIDEKDMNATIGVTSSSPAYVFKFIDAICKGATAQGLDGENLVDTVCDVLIGSAMLLKQSSDSPAALISKVASKGGTTEQALIGLDNGNFDKVIESAMIACTNRANELGKK